MSEIKPRNPVAVGCKYRDLDVKYRRRRRVVEVTDVLNTHAIVRSKGKPSLVSQARLADPSRFELIERPAEVQSEDVSDPTYTRPA